MTDNERTIYIAQDGLRYPLTVRGGARTVLSYEGTGMPPIEHITERGPFQHGETLNDYFLRPRILQYVIRQNFCSRQEYFNGRAALLDALRPNRGLNGVIRKILPGGQKRDIKVTILEGPKFEPDSTTRWDQWSLQEVLRFIAHDPTYYDPTEIVSTFGPCNAGFPYTFPFPFPIDCEVQYPVTYPITYSEFNIFNEVVNDGSWISFPIIEINGPAFNVRIDNETTGESLSFLGYTIPPGETVVIDLSFGTKTVKLASTGEDLIQYLGDDSDLAEFHIEPGVNNFRVRVDSYGAATTVDLRYHSRYIGV